MTIDEKKGDEVVYKEFLKVLQNLDKPDVLNETNLINSPLTHKYRQSNPLLSPAETLKLIFTDLLDKLDPEQKQILKLRFWDGLSVEATTDHLNQEGTRSVSMRTVQDKQKKGVESLIKWFFEKQNHLTPPPIAKEEKIDLPFPINNPKSLWRWRYPIGFILVAFVIVSSYVGYSSLPTTFPAVAYCDEDKRKILISKGEFIFGSTPAEVDLYRSQCTPSGDCSEYFQDELPIYSQVNLDSFCISRYEVTNREYKKFVNETGYKTTAEERGDSIVYNFIAHRNDTIAFADWQHPTGPTSSILGLDNNPVVHVSLEDSVNYCIWAGGRIPTTQEWQKAARGPNGNLYPWGNEWKAEMGNYADTKRSTTLVGSYPQGASYYGVEDMMGNVMEWTSSPYDFDMQQFIVHGGGWASRQPYLHLSWINEKPANATSNATGFRCVWDYQP